MYLESRLLKTVLFVVALSFQTAIFGQQTQPLITNTAGRETISLNGSWQVIIDPYENGYYAYRVQPRNDGYFKNARPKSVSDLIEFDFDSSQQLQVPGDWNSQDQRLLSEVRPSKFFTPKALANSSPGVLPGGRGSIKWSNTSKVLANAFGVLCLL